MNKKDNISYPGATHILAEGERKIRSKHNKLILYLLEVIECYGKTKKYSTQEFRVVEGYRF